MNIKEHIEAGHYPKDKNGYAVVPTKERSGSATIWATRSGIFDGCIVGRVYDEAHAWSDGGKHKYGSNDLLPPPPRKVPITGWALVRQDGSVAEVRREKPDRLAVSQFHIVELTGEHEVPYA